MQQRESNMADLKIRVFKGNGEQPETTVTIPGGVLKIASRLVPRKVAASLEEKGINLEEIVRLSQDPEVHGPLVEIEEHQKNERVVISLE
jgi:hypothetical protein